MSFRSGSLKFVGAALVAAAMLAPPRPASAGCVGCRRPVRRLAAAAARAATCSMGRVLHVLLPRHGCLRRACR